MDEALTLLTELPSPLVYAVLAAGAVVENIVPAIPADTFIVVGGFVAGLGTLSVGAVFGVVWFFNVAGAVAVYALGRRYGRQFFRTGRGRKLIPDGQWDRLEAFYGRWGVAAIFAGRFFPGFRALVPVFAGVAGLGSLRVVPPLAIASAIWYGVLVRLGFLAGDNLEAVTGAVARTQRWLLVGSVVLAAVLAWLWWRARRRGTA
ncbi:MAG: DedA family protein [Gemmatimonadota bacterium]|nr:DedA family protein [Gemmatimonadota bacterium]MDE2676758.1 DedA family protein [Gemmatimonadota bacterium]MYD14585.1 DedA family protein [Gemmatimonadota bacterium]